MQEEPKLMEIGPIIKIISHDLRGPLGNLKSVVTLFKSGELPIEQATQFMNHIEDGVDKSIEMLDGLLEWGLASSVSTKPSDAEVELKEVILELKDKFEKDLTEKSIQFTFDEGTSCLTSFNKNALRVILRNLFSNAIKFTPKGGQVVVEVQEDSNGLIVSVLDDGIGLPEAMRDHIFEVNKDNRRPGTENEKGAGLGLFMCHDLIQRNGSAIWVEENPTGQGSKFSFSLKKA